MAVNMNAVSVLPAIAVTPVAPLIEGAAAAVLNATTSAAFATSAYYNFGSSLTGRYGMRCNLASPLNFSGYDFVTFAANSQQFDPGSALDSVANGGIRIYFIDGAGNYSGFNIGGYLPLYSTDTAAANGFFMQYNSVNLIYSIATARTPDVAGGVLNWSNIVAIEVTTKTISASRKDFHISRLAKRSAPIVTGSETLAGLSSAAASVVNGTTGDPFLLKAAAMYLGAAAQTNFNIRLGLTIGDGLAATSFIESNFAIGFETLYEYSPAAKSHGPWVQLDNAKTRAFKVNQSASDVLNLTDGSIASPGGWQWELSGSGVATCTRMQFWRFNGFRAAHGDYIDCAWNDADTPVEVTAATVISGGLIRGAKATGLKVLGAAGVYSNLDLSIDSLVGTYDIELGAGGAGTYDLPHITVPAGRTLRIRNNSASNAVVVKLPLGLAYSTSTAGGAITVTIPEVSVSIAAPSLVAGSRVQLYSITDGAEMLNGVLGGAGLMYTALYTGNKIIRLRADHATKLPLETLGVLTASGLTFLDVQVEDDVYLGNGIDGGSVTEFAPDGAHIEVDINDPDGVTDIQRLYAWLQWYMTTEEGVRSAFFGAVSAIDSANYVIDQTKADIKLDNVAATPVRIVGGYLSRRDGSTVIAPLSHSIQMDPGKAYAIETGVSGLTIDESNKLNAIGTLALEATAQAVKAHTTTLVARPASPTTAQVVTGVWADPAAAALALEATAQAIKADSAALVARPATVAPTAAEVTAAVWADAAAASLALEATSQQLVAGGSATAGKVDTLIARPAPTAAPTAAQVASAVRVEVAPELVRVVELAKVHGLVAGSSLVVSPTTRTAGDISQTISESGGVTTVSRA